MALINHRAREIHFKIVYYGPGLGGKTTNLRFLHDRLPPERRGRLISIATDHERTLFFDFLPIDLGQVNGYLTRFHLYTVPGQVYYRLSRRAVLQGADGLVFVADSHPAREQANVDSLADLATHLQSLALTPAQLERMPRVFQWNKRDLRGGAAGRAAARPAQPARRARVRGGGGAGARRERDAADHLQGGAGPPGHRRTGRARRAGRRPARRAHEPARPPHRHARPGGLGPGRPRHGGERGGRAGRLVPAGPAARVALLLIAGVAAVSVWSAGEAEKVLGHDAKPIVIDEVVGQSLALLLVPHSAWAFLAAFLLFRLFDIWKPLGARESQDLPGGWGIIADDVIAGLTACAVFHAGTALLGAANLRPW